MYGYPQQPGYPVPSNYVPTAGAGAFRLARAIVMSGPVYRCRFLFLFWLAKGTFMLRGEPC